jgi:hypothetical protein
VLVLTLGAARPVQAQVQPADLSALSPSDFRDDELDLPYYLAHFHRIANSVALSGPRRGFIDIPAWRDVKDNQPYNARIMESILSLVYFYTVDRPWNPYRGDRARCRSGTTGSPTMRCLNQRAVARSHSIAPSNHDSAWRRLPMPELAKPSREIRLPKS